MNKIKLLLIIFILINVSGCRKKTDTIMLTEKQDEIESSSIETQTQKNDNDLTEEKNEDYPPPDLYGTVDVNYNGSLYFWDLDIHDSIDTVKEKLSLNGLEFEDGIDYAGVHKIWNKGIMIQEWENLNFVISYYNQHLVSFIKYNVSIQELQKICQYYGESFDVSTLKYQQIYFFKRGEYEISVGNLGYPDKRDLYVFTIRNFELAKNVREIYDSFE